MAEEALTPYTLVGRAGDSFTRTLVWADDAGDPIDLTGASVEWSLKRGATEYQYEDDAHASVTDPTAGEVTLALTFAETRALGAIARSWRYEVTVLLANLTTRTTVLAGVLEFGKEVVE